MKSKRWVTGKYPGGYKKHSLRIILDDDSDVSEIDAALLLLLQKKNNLIHRAQHRTFTVDWNDRDSVFETCKILQGRNAHLRKRVGKLYTNREILDAYEDIMNTDISLLFENTDYSNDNRYCVYFHCDKANPIKINHKSSPLSVFAASMGLQYYPFYVGKGTGDRPYKKERNGYHKIKSKDDFHVFIYKSNINEQEALSIEQKMVDIFGIYPEGGRLTNIDIGNAKDRRFLYRDAYEKIRGINKTNQ